MPLFLFAFLSALASIAANVVGRVLIALGIGYVTYQGLDILLTQAQNLVFLNLTSGYLEINAALNMLNIGKAVNVTFSAIAARNLLNGLTSGAFTKQVIK